MSPSSEATARDSGKSKCFGSRVSRSEYMEGLHAAQFWLFEVDNLMHECTWSSEVEQIVHVK